MSNGPEGAGVSPGSRRDIHVALAILLVTLGLAGCACGGPGKPELTVFRVDEIRYWFEGDDRIVINVTITNQVNFTPSGIFPSLRVAVDERLARPGANGPGEDLQLPMPRGFTLHFVPGTPMSRQSDGRWVWGEKSCDECAPRTGAENGPIQITPGMSVSREFEFPVNPLHGQEGYYSIRVHANAHFSENQKEQYPDYRTNPFGIYYSGCFNHDVPEFYGIGADLDCIYWDCTGLSTRDGYSSHRGIKDSYKPVCDATNATGPDYSV